jgi:site-specific recombinase XerD
LLRCNVEGRFPRTVRTYRETRHRFLRALDEDGGPTQPADIESAHVYSHLGRYTHLRTEPRHRYFREVRCFFNWLVEAEYLEQFPFRGMRTVHVPQRTVQAALGRGDRTAACHLPLRSDGGT